MSSAILPVLLAGYILGDSALLRRAEWLVPGLSAAWLVTAALPTVGEFTFDRWLNSIRSDGIGGWRSWRQSWVAPGHLAGRVTPPAGGGARLATATAALGRYLNGVLAGARRRDDH